MSVSFIVNQYQNLSKSQGTAGNGGSVAVNYADDILTFTEADGDVYTMKGLSLSDTDITSLGSLFGISISKDPEVNKTTGANAQDGELNELTDSAEGKQSEIKGLSKEIKAIYKETLDEQEKLTKEEYLRILQVIEEQVEQFKQDKLSGKEVNASDLQGSIMAAVADTSYGKEIAAVFANLKNADTKIQHMSRLLDELGEITGQVRDIERTQLEAMAAEMGEDVDYSKSNLFAEGGSAGILSGAVFSEEEANSKTFALSSFNEIYTEKLAGHKDQYKLVAGFEDLDDRIIDMYLDYADGISTAVDEYYTKQAENIFAQDPDAAEGEDKKAQEEQQQEEALAA